MNLKKKCFVAVLLGVTFMANSAISEAKDSTRKTFDVLDAMNEGSDDQASTVLREVSDFEAQFNPTFDFNQDEDYFVSDDEEDALEVSTDQEYEVWFRPYDFDIVTNLPEVYVSSAPSVMYAPYVFSPAAAYVCASGGPDPDDSDDEHDDSILGRLSRFTIGGIVDRENEQEVFVRNRLMLSSNDFLSSIDYGSLSGMVNYSPLLTINISGDDGYYSAGDSVSADYFHTYYPEYRRSIGNYLGDEYIIAPEGFYTELEFVPEYCVGVNPTDAKSSALATQTLSYTPSALVSPPSGSIPPGEKSDQIKFYKTGDDVTVQWLRVLVSMVMASMLGMCFFARKRIVDLLKKSNGFRK